MEQGAGRLWEGLDPEAMVNILFSISASFLLPFFPQSCGLCVSALKDNIRGLVTFHFSFLNFSFLGGEEGNILHTATGCEHN